MELIAMAGVLFLYWLFDDAWPAIRSIIRTAKRWMKGKHVR